MSKLIVRFLAILGALWLISMVIMLAYVIGAKGRVPSKTILEANFEQPFARGHTGYSCRALHDERPRDAARCDRRD